MNVQDQNTQETLEGDKPQIKFPKPKVALIDLDRESYEILTENGFNVSVGSFGSPYKASRRNTLQPVFSNATLAGLSEQEIVIIDLAANTLPDQPPKATEFSVGGLDAMSLSPTGIIDPRPLEMFTANKACDRIIDHGGVFIIFVEPRRTSEFLFGENTEYGFKKKDSLALDNYSFLTILGSDYMEFSSDIGEEIDNASSHVILRSILNEFLPGSSFNCVIGRTWKVEEKHWFPLALNKYGNPVMVGVYAGKSNGTEGSWVFALPQIANRGQFLVAFVQDFLPALLPQLFPFSDKGLWVHGKDYELPIVHEKLAEIAQVEQTFQKEIERLNSAIETLRNENAFMYNLLTATDRVLVTSVIEALKQLGFSEVIDVDQEREKEGEAANLREDIQVRDISPTLIVDVKGIVGNPSDPDCLQANKHVMIRMRETSSTDFRGLMIINHQKNLPPLARDNDKTFRKEMVDAAMEGQYGLLTTFDLWRLLRSRSKLGWSDESIRPIFYRDGRVEITPEHYSYFGRVIHFFDKIEVYGVKVEQGSIAIGDRIAFETPIEFGEGIVESIHKEDQVLKEASAGMEVGIKITPTCERLRKGVRLFRVT